MAERQIDWIRLLHRGFTLARALRGDSKLEADQAEEQGRAYRFRGTIHEVARQAVGCARTPECGCPVCSDARE